MQLEHLSADKRPNLQCLSDCLDCLNGLLIALNKERAIVGAFSGNCEGLLTTLH